MTSDPPPPASPVPPSPPGSVPTSSVPTSSVPLGPATGDLPAVRIPERPEPLSPPLIVRRLVFVAVLVTVAASVPVTLLAGFRPGGSVLAAALLMSSVARAVLPAQYCLGLLVRSRRADAITTAVLAVSVAICAAIVPDGRSG